MGSRRGAAVALLGLFLLVFIAIVFVSQLKLPDPTGSYTVGRAMRSWVDSSRQEALDSADYARETPVIIWYPAETGSGTKMPYFPALDNVASGLAASGEVGGLEVLGLRMVRSQERLDGAVAGGQERYPLILFSPGNGTNVQFYDALAGDLASHGYIVVGVNHPYDVAAVALQDGRVAQFVDGPMSFAGREEWTRERIAERTADLLFVLNQLQTLNGGGDALLSGRMDLDHVGVMGHSLGGITAAQACQAAAAFAACLNLDGLQRGGPFSAAADPTPTNQPFMMITKERELPPALAALFAAVPSGSYRVVLPEADHDSFTDGPLLRPALRPNQAEEILSQVRAYTLAFFEQTLRGRESELLERPTNDGVVVVEVYSQPKT